MKIKILFSVTTLFIGPLLAAQAGPAEDITSAAQKLGNEASYSWHTTVVLPAGTPLSPGPIDGKIEKDGLMHLTRSPIQNPPPGSQFPDVTLEILARGTNILVADPDPDGGWETLAGFQASDLVGPGRFVGDMMQHFKAPAAQAADLAGDSVHLTQTDGAYAGELSPAAAKELLAFPADSNATVSNISGTVEFWVKDGELMKFEYKVAGTAKSGDKEDQIKRDTTVEIQDVGSTKIRVPADAQKLLQ
jgi:hypothetical protein